MNRIFIFFLCMKYYQIEAYIIKFKSLRKEISLYNTFDFKGFQFENFSRIEYPKVSVIITLYNQKSYILKIYLCLLKQTLKEIEIIFIDDASIDNSDKVVEKLMEKDKRIVFLKNKKNKGQFYSIKKAVFHAKGNYVIIIDPDDFLLNNILIKSYNKAIKYNLDIVQFFHLEGSVEKNNLIMLINKSKICYQPEVQNIFFDCGKRYLWNKLIKKNIFIKSIYFIKEKFRNERFIIHNDEVINLGIFKLADSFWQVKEVGYFYNKKNPNSTWAKCYLPENINGIYHSLFSIMDYYYEQTENNYYEKTKSGFDFFNYQIVSSFGNKLKYLTKDFKYINEVLMKYINCSVFNPAQKELLKNFKEKVGIQKLFQIDKKIEKIKNRRHHDY